MRNLKLFFEEYANSSLNKKATDVAGFYAQNFMAVSRTESMSFKNDEKFIVWLDEIFEFNKKVGLQQMSVQKISSENIGEKFYKVTVTWSLTFAARPQHNIDFDIHYILKEIGKSFEILLYISEQDQEELMKKHGVIKNS